MKKILLFILLFQVVNVNLSAQITNDTIIIEDIETLRKIWDNSILKDIFKPNKRKYPQAKKQEQNEEKNTNNNEKQSQTNANNQLNNSNNDWYYLAWDITEYAKQFLGTRYRYGGESPKRGFDCSGFTQYVFREFDIYLDRTSKQQSRDGKKIRLNQADMGDLIIFGKSKNNITHVGIVYTDKNEDLKVIHSTSSQGVTITNLETDSYWRKKMLFAVRLF